ncbi:hypothetical protein Anas_11162, partial [Armadillidium nasatum]
TPELRRITILTIVSSLVFGGLSLSAINFKLDPFMYMIVGGLIEIPAYSLVIPIIVKTGMIPFTAGSFFICGINVLILAFISSEVFPTEVRMQGLGTSSFFSTIGSISVPFITELLKPFKTLDTSTCNMYG